MRRDEPWVVDDVWSETFEADVEAMDRAARGLGAGFLLFAGVIAALFVCFVLAGGVGAVIEVVFAGTGDG